METLPQFKDRLSNTLPDNSDRDKLERGLMLFVENALAKFDRGRAEHGDNLSLLDCDKEIESEVLDIVNYLIIKKF